MRTADYFVFTLAALVIAVVALNLMRVPLGRTWEALAEGVRRIRIWQVAIGAALVSLLFLIFDFHAARSGIPQFVLVVTGVIWFVSAWLHEFFLLMALRDDDFPGRFDKPIWAALLIGMAPLGLFLFRAYRLAHWPEPRSKTKTATDHLAEELT